MVLNSGVGSLTISDAGEIVAFQIGETVFAQGNAGSAMTLLYSDAASMWEAKRWVELQPDAAEVSAAEKAVSIRYPSFGGKKISAVLTITAEEDGFVLRASLLNGDGGVAVGAKVLRMQGFVERGGALYIPDRAGQRMEAPFEKLREQRCEFKYPVPMSAQHLTYTTGEQTWSVQVLDETMAYKRMLLGGEEAGMEIEEYCFLEPGCTGALPPVRMVALEENWHGAIDLYRQWFDSWAVKVKRSALINEMPPIASAVILARPEEDATLRDVTKDQELKTYDGALQRMTAQRVQGFEGSQLVGWHGLGHDTDYPVHAVADAMGGCKGLERLSRHMRNLGMQVGYYTNARLGNIKLPIYDQIQQWMVKPEEGRDIREIYGAEWFEILCPMAEGFIQLMEEKAREMTSRYNADFFQLDQIGAAQCYLCFDKTHGHSTPATAWAEGYARFIDRVTAAGREYNPGFWTWCEGAWEGAGQHLDLQQGGYWPFKDASYAPELYRYTFPGHALMCDGYLGGVCMWAGSPADSGIRIMKNFEDFYVSARFMDDNGLEWSGRGVRCKWHLGENAAAIIARNFSETAVETAVALKSAQANLPETFYGFDMLTAEMQTFHKGDALKLTVPAGETRGLYLYW